MKRYFEKRTHKINYLMRVQYPHSQRLNKDSVCNCANAVTGCDLINTETGQVIETIFVCPRCSLIEKEEAEKKAREERIKNYVFRPEIQSKLDRNKRISKYDLTHIIEDIEGVHCCYALFVDYFSRAQIVRKFNGIFGTDIK